MEGATRVSNTGGSRLRRWIMISTWHGVSNTGGSAGGQLTLAKTPSILYSFFPPSTRGGGGGGKVNWGGPRRPLRRPGPAAPGYPAGQARTLQPRPCPASAASFKPAAHGCSAPQAGGRSHLCEARGSRWHLWAGSRASLRTSPGAAAHTQNKGSSIRRNENVVM